MRRYITRMAKQVAADFYAKVGRYFLDNLKTVAEPVERNAEWLNKILAKVGLMDFKNALNVFLLKIERAIMYFESLIDYNERFPQKSADMTRVIVDAYHKTLSEALDEALIDHDNDSVQIIDLKLMRNDVQQIIAAIQ